MVEVQGNTRTGQLAQDFAIADGGLAPNSADFELQPATLVGEFLRDTGGTTAIYANTVTVRVRGESELIPGVLRSYQSTFTKPERGTYSLPVGAGRYLVTAEPLDEAIPPVEAGVSVSLGTNTSVSFAFSPSEKTIAVTGRLLKRIELGPIPVEIPLQSLMDVQAVDPVTLHPLSQRAKVTTAGVFFLFVAPEAQVNGKFLVLATAREPGALVPSKTFELALPLSPEIRLVMGEFGDPLPQMQGELQTTSGIPVAGASVYLEGPVNGGGVFRSKVVSTDSKGVFKVDLLPSSFDGAYLLTALPPPNSPAGVVQRAVRTVMKSGSLPRLQVVSLSENTSTVICPDKITVMGLIHPPGKSTEPAVGTKVVARAVEQLKSLGKQPLPMGNSEGETDENGRFSLELDPGIYQLDFIPGKDLPRTTRVVTVDPQMNSDLDAGMPSSTIVLSDSELRNGRKVTGIVTALSALTLAPQVAVNATVRYFRVSSVGGQPASLLLGEVVTDSVGKYSIILPAK